MDWWSECQAARTLQLHPTSYDDALYVQDSFEPDVGHKQEVLGRLIERATGVVLHLSHVTTQRSEFLFYDTQYPQPVPHQTPDRIFCVFQAHPSRRKIIINDSETICMVNMASRWHKSGKVDGYGGKLIVDDLNGPLKNDIRSRKDFLEYFQLEIMPREDMLPCISHLISEAGLDL
jgi:hypothetical protein